MNEQLDIKTFGCKVNTYDSGLLESRLAKFDFGSGVLPRIHILNTCAVTAEATQDAVRTARRLKTKEPNSVVVITGCAAQVDTEKFAELQSADLVIANSHKGELENILARYLKGDRVERVFKSNIFKKDDLEAGGGEELGHTRSFLKIQDGCNSFCTFCVIPFARGKSRSIEPQVLIDKVNELSVRGVKEVVLTGVHIGDYESENGNKLETLVRLLLTETSIERFRLSSLEPVELSDELLELYKNPRMCRHFHMSIQSANTKVLKDMKRHYGSGEVEQSLNKIASALPGAFVGMDVIAGFPGESEEEFADTFATLERSPWTRIHVFPYSARPNTYAAKAFEPLKPNVVHARARRLRELSLERYKSEALKQVGSTKQTLVIKSNEGSRGLSRDYWPLRWTEPSITGAEISVLVASYEPPSSLNPEGILHSQPLA